MALIMRRSLVAAGGTLAAGLIARKPRAAVVPGDLASHLVPDDNGVVLLSSDRGGAKVVEAFYEEHGIVGLPVLLCAITGGRQRMPSRCMVFRPA